MPSATIFRLGWTNPQTDLFGAHPQLGSILDLNDGAAFALASPAGVQLPPPPRTILTAGNVRAQGERATRAVYRHNRRVVVRLLAGPMSTYSDLATNIRALVSWLAAPPAIPFTIQYQPIGASAPVYLDVVGAAHDIPADEDDWLRLQLEPVTLVFLARPGLRGDRVTLSNLAVNPGFEAPSGPAVPVFADPFTNTSAYTLAAGSAPTLSPANTYADIVLADAPNRYHRLDESSGATAFDIAGGAHAGAYSGGFTLGAAGALIGDPDTACAFNGSTAKVSIPTTLLPAGNQPVSMECWFKFAAAPAGNQFLICYGSTTPAAHNAFQIYITPAGAVQCDVVGAGVITSAAVSANAYHHVLVTWDGTTLTLYVDGASRGTAAPGAQAIPTSSTALTLGVNTSATSGFYSGQIDEVAVYSAALSAARASAHFTAGSAGPSGTVTSAMSLPAGAQVSFGSPDWSAVNIWQTRFRYTLGLTATWYLHYADASNNLAVQIAAGANACALVHTVAGVATTLASATASLTPSAWCWLQLTQFPTVPGDPPYLQALLSYDAAGSPGAALITLAAAASATVALSGQPRLAASGAALPIGGLSSGAGHQLALFGPGGWTFTSFSDATAPASGAWDTTTTYPGGPVASLAAARIDAPPAGTFHAAWRLYSGATPIPLSAVAIPATPAVLNVAAYAQSSGLSAAATLSLVVREYDVSGALLRSGAAASLTGNQPTWVQLAGGYTTGASCAYVDLACEAKDLSAPGASANAVVWFDNVQFWNQTATGMTSMPYCELRFPQSPAQLVVSGLLGDLPAPAFLAFGAYLASWPKGASLAFAIGRRGSLSATACLAGPSNGFYGTTFTPTSTAALDPSAYGGYYVQTTLTAGWNPRAFSLAPTDAPGAYHLIGRFLTQQASANLANVRVRALVEQRLQPWYGAADQSDQLGVYYGPFTAPISASAAWTIADSGPVTLPPFAQGALADPAQTYVTPHMQWSDSTPGGSVCQMSWQALLPVDGALLAGLANNPTNAPAAVTARWLWAYAGGLATASSQPAAWTYSLETTPTPAPAHAGGGPGTQTTGSVNLNPGADPTLTLDPNLRLAGAPGVNQLLAYLADNSAAVLPVFAEIAYSPLYLYPR